MPLTIEKLQELKQLHAEGLISDAVYAARQHALLENPASPVDPAKPVRHLNKLFWVSLVVLIGGLAGWFGYRTAGRDTKDLINYAVATTGIGTNIVPWSDRADTVLRSLIPDNSQRLAKVIQLIAHPSGTNPMFYGYNVSQLSNRVQVEISVEWTGGVIGNRYKTVIVWDISEAKHESARVVSDTALTEISQHSAQQLDDFFRAKMYPAFYRGLTGG